jgi:hypothetical protein
MPQGRRKHGSSAKAAVFISASRLNLRRIGAIIPYSFITQVKKEFE